jgi:hypothetical protein
MLICVLIDIKNNDFLIPANCVCMAQYSVYLQRRCGLPTGVTSLTYVMLSAALTCKKEVNEQT